MSSPELTVGLLTSGRLGASVLKQIGDKLDIAFIATDKGSEGIKRYADAQNIPSFVGNPRQGRALEVLKEFPIDVLLSVNYLFLIEQDLINFPKLAAINYHGSLLPRYRGRTPHVWAIINGETSTGVTAHQIVSECDAGDILIQREITISPDETGAGLLEAFERMYPEMIRETMEALAEGVRFQPQEHELASYFGKRVPEDGQIDWSWQRFRIRNWVRAQTPPYPGAFSYCGNIKIRIDWVEFTNIGFSDSDPNGLILSHNQDHLLVKAPDGVLAITRYEDAHNALKAGLILS